MKPQVHAWQSGETAPSFTPAISTHSIDVKLIETATAFLLRVSRAAETVVDGENQHQA